MRSILRERGFTLTELLVVVSIVVLLTALSIPAVMRMGVFSSNRTADAAREYYQMLRAARLYATTNNVETAIVYQTRLVYETANDDESGIYATDMVPIVDGYIICRRATRQEVEQTRQDFIDPASWNDVHEGEPIFIPIPESDGRFRMLPGGTCILPDLFEVDPAAPLLSVRALSPVFVIDPALVQGDPAETGFMRPLQHPNSAARLHFQQQDGDSATELDGGNPAGAPNNQDPFEVTVIDPPASTLPIHAFPAHRFAPSGEMIPFQSKQRFRARLGMLPTTIPNDRFVTFDDAAQYDPDADPTDTQRVTIQFHSADTAAATEDTETAYVFHDPRRVNAPGVDPEYTAGDPDGFAERQFLENVAELSIYTATGRVKIEPTIAPPDLENT